MAPVDNEHRDGQARASVGQLSDAIASLRRSLDAHGYREFWRDVRRVSSLFKELPAVPRDARERLWADFSALCERAKKENLRERERRAHVSHGKKVVVLGKISDAYYRAKGATSESDLRLADQWLAEALEWAKPGWRQVSIVDDLFSITDGRMTQSDHDTCWQRWKEVKETVKWKRHEFQEARVRRQAEGRTKMSEARSRAVDRVDKARSVVRSLESQIEDCRDRQRNARSSGFEADTGMDRREAAED